MSIGNVFVLVFSVMPFALSCPPSEVLHPCVCHSTILGDEIKCSGFDSDHALLSTLLSVPPVEVHSFEIENYNSRYLPHNIFERFKFKDLRITSSSLQALTDTDIAFEGLENDLIQLAITKSTLLNDWEWSALRKLKHLTTLLVEEGDLTFISEDFQMISSLKLCKVFFNKNQISHIHDAAFATFSEMLWLDLQENKIGEVKRSMLPNPARKLQGLNL